MAQDMNIGAARVYLTVDTVDYVANLQRALNAAVGFGTDAERAFDKSAGGTRRASQRLLDYVADLGKTNTELTRFESLLRKASAGGADQSVLKAAARAWDDYATNVALTRIETESWERLTKRAVGATRELEQAQRSEAAAAREAANARAKMYVEGRAAQQAENAQGNFNALLGVQGPRDAGYLAEQRRVIAALEQQVLVEQQVEAQAREIHQEWSAIERQINAVGKSTYDIMRMNAQQKYGANAAPLIEQINRWEKLNTTMSGSTVNAKQLQQAIRYLPAQFTDIATSLAGGMNPLLVLFQQGGQIFDQFRLSGAGVGDTLRTVGSYALRLVNPLTIAGAAVAAIGFAAFSAAKDLDAFTVAAIRTGEISGNAQQLKDYAATLDQIQGVTSGKALEAVQKIAGNGILIGENFRLASDAAVRWSSVTGDSIDQVSQKFADIAKDPLAALERLNQSEHFLTATQRERIRVLQEQGDIQQAINEATRIYYDVVISRSGQVEQSLSNISLLWRDIKDGTSGALQEFKNYADGMAGRARDLLKYKDLLSAGLPGLFLGTSAALATPKTPVKFPFELDFRTGNALSQTEVRAINFVEDALRGSRTEAEKFSDEVKKLNGNLRNLPTAELTKLGIARNGDQFSGEAYDKLVDSLRPKPKKVRGTSARSAAREVRYDFEAQLAMLRTQARETEAAYSLQEISATKYYETLSRLAVQERDIQLASNNAQIEAIQGKKGSEQELARLRAQNVQVEQQYLQREIDLRTQQAQLTKQYNDEYRQLVYSLQDGTEAMRQQMELEAISLGMSDKQFGRLQARIEIERDRERQLRELDRRVEENANFAEEAERRKVVVIEETNRKLAAQAELYGYIDAATGNWLTGAEKAWQEWLDQVGDVSGKAYDFFSTAFDGLADLTTDFLTGSEANWKDYLNNLARMITRFVVEQQLTKWMQSLKVGGDSGGGVMGFVGNLFGALLGSGGGNPNTVSYAPGGSFTWNPAVRPFAEGGIPSGLSAYRNQVVSSPTLFPFAAGGVPNWGLMGEAGREAIVPLTRMPGGNLGVEARMPAGGGAIAIQQTFVVNGTPDRMTRGQMLRMAGAETSRAIRRG